MNQGTYDHNQISISREVREEFLSRNSLDVALNAYAQKNGVRQIDALFAK